MLKADMRDAGKKGHLRWSAACGFFGSGLSMLLSVMLVFGLLPVAFADEVVAGDTPPPATGDAPDGSAQPDGADSQDPESTPVPEGDAPAGVQPAQPADADLLAPLPQEPTDADALAKTLSDPVDDATLEANLALLDKLEITPPAEPTCLVLDPSITQELYALQSDTPVVLQALAGTSSDMLRIGPKFKKVIPFLKTGAGLISKIRTTKALNGLAADLDAVQKQLDDIYGNTEAISKQIGELGNMITENELKTKLGELQEISDRWKGTLKRCGERLDELYGYVEYDEAKDVYVVNEAGKALHDYSVSRETNFDHAEAIFQAEMDAIIINDLARDVSSVSTLLSHTSTGTSIIAKYNDYLDTKYLFEHETIEAGSQMADLSSRLYYSLVQLYAEKVASDAETTTSTANYGVEVGDFQVAYESMVSNLDALVKDMGVYDRMIRIGFTDTDFAFDESNGNHASVASIVRATDSNGDTYSTIPAKLKVPFPIDTYTDPYKGTKGGKTSGLVGALNSFRVVSIQTGDVFYIADRTVDNMEVRVTHHYGINDAMQFLGLGFSEGSTTLLTSSASLEAACAKVNASEITFDFTKLLTNAIKDPYGRASAIVTDRGHDRIPLNQPEYDGSTSNGRTWKKRPALSANAHHPGETTYVQPKYDESCNVEGMFLIAIEISEETYNIRTVEEFLAASRAFNAPREAHRTFNLMADITLPDNAASTMQTLSNATFEGNGHTVTYTISGYKGSATDGAGLFGEMVNATVRNLNVVGGVGRVDGDGGVGGVAGRMENSLIENSTSMVKVYCEDVNVGGIVGYAKNSDIVNCTYIDKKTGYTGDPKARTSIGAWWWKSGGIAGHVETNGTGSFVGNRVCLDKGNTDTGYTHTVDAPGKWVVGGLIGELGGLGGDPVGFVMQNCVYAGKPIKNDSAEWGGLVGKVKGVKLRFDKCITYNTGHKSSAGWGAGWEGKLESGALVSRTPSFIGSPDKDGYKGLNQMLYRDMEVEYRYADGTVKTLPMSRVWYGEMVSVEAAPEGQRVQNVSWSQFNEEGDTIRTEPAGLAPNKGKNPWCATADIKFASADPASTLQVNAMKVDNYGYPLSGKLVVSYAYDNYLSSSPFEGDTGVQLSAASLEGANDTLARVHATLLSELADAQEVTQARSVLDAGLFGSALVDGYLDQETVDAFVAALRAEKRPLFSVRARTLGTGASSEPIAQYAKAQGWDAKRVVECFDLTTDLMAADTALGQLKLLDRPIELNATIPASLQQAGMTYGVVRSYYSDDGGVVTEAVDSSANGATVAFKADRGAVYAVVALPVNAPGAGSSLAATGDTTLAFAAVGGLVALLALCACVWAGTRRKRA